MSFASKPNFIILSISFYTSINCTWKIFFSQSFSILYDILVQIYSLEFAFKLSFSLRLYPLIKGFQASGDIAERLYLGIITQNQVNGTHLCFSFPPVMTPRNFLFSQSIHQTQALTHPVFLKKYCDLAYKRDQGGVLRFLKRFSSPGHIFYSLH